MLLGDLIARLEDEVVAMETLVSLGDLPLMMRVEEEAAALDLTLGEFASQAVALFSSQASDEDWVSLVGAMGRADDPGRACLKRMVEFALRPQGEPVGCAHHA